MANESEENLSNGFRGFGSVLDYLHPRNLMGFSRQAFLSHFNDEEELDPSEVPPIKRRRLSQDPLPDENQDRDKSFPSTNDFDAAAVNDTVEIEGAEKQHNDTVNSNAAETLSTSTKATHAPKSGFYLLNEETLVKIFDYLEMYDLLQACDADKRIKKVIAEEIMKSRVLDISNISKHCSVRHAFKFGGLAPEIMVKLSDIQWKDKRLSEIEEIVRLIGKRCSRVSLKKLSITFDLKDKGSCEFRKEVPDCFKSLESLTIIHHSGRSVNFDNCLETLLSACTGLKSLTLHRVGSDGKFLMALNSMNHLERLTMDICCISNSQYWLEFVHNGIASLKSLSWEHVHISGLGEDTFKTIYSFLPNLEELSFDSADFSMSEFCGCASFLNLKVLRLKCSWNETSVVAALNTLHNLQELYIEIRDRYGVIKTEDKTAWLNAMKELKVLQTIKIHSLNYYHWNWDTAVEMVANLPNVQLVHLKGPRAFTQKNIEELVSISPSIVALLLDAPIKMFTPKLYNTLVRDRSRWYRKSERLNIFMNHKICSRLKESITGYTTKANCICLRPL